jgi:hypothetical protein
MHIDGKQGALPIMPDFGVFVGQEGWKLPVQAMTMAVVAGNRGFAFVLMLTGVEGWEGSPILPIFRCLGGEDVAV